MNEVIRKELREEEVFVADAPLGLQDMQAGVNLLFSLQT